MKKSFKCLLLAVVTLSAFFPLLAIKNPAHAQDLVKIAVVGDSTDQIWEVVQENLGDTVQVALVTMTDPVQANQALVSGEVDLAAFQHYAALAQYNEDNGTEITPITETFISPMNTLSNQIDSIDELKEGDTILIPESPTNRGRALKVLEDAGLITIDSEAGDSPEIKDITNNPLKLEIEEVDQAFIMTALPDAAAGLTVANNVIDAGVDPVDDAIYTIEIDPSNEDLKPYFNLITTLPDRVDDPTFEAIITAYHQENVKNHIKEEYNNGMIPVW